MTPRLRRSRELPRPLPQGAPAAELDGLTIQLSGRVVLDRIDLSFTTGEVHALAGPNGAGKSTLLAALAADIPPTHGAVKIAGRPARHWRAPELALLRAMLPQSAELSFPFTAEEVVRMGRAPHRGTPAEDDDDNAVARAMAATETHAFAGRPFARLSGGERARVALARVLAQQAPLLLLDEPTAALDLRHQEHVMRIARQRAERDGDAVAVALHDLGLAAAYADRITLLDSGTVASTGTPQDVFNEKTLTRVYRHPVEVLAHPHNGGTLVVPRRDQARGDQRAYVK